MKFKSAPKLLLSSVALCFILFNALGALASPRLEVLEVMQGYPAGSRLPVGLLIHPPDGEGLLAPAENGGPGPALNLALSQSHRLRLEDAQIMTQPVDGLYHDFMPIKAFLYIDPMVEPGEVLLEASFNFATQPGQERRFNFSWPITILPPEQAAEEIFSSETAMLLQLGGQSASSENASHDMLAGHSMVIILLLVFLGGLALNLTPCVYPVIPITISYFVSQAGASRGTRLAGALAYWLGMVVMYSALGLFAALGGGILGQALTHPAVLIGLVLILLLLASSMFGLWELKMPGKLNQLAATNRRGLGGALFMGLTVGVLAAPCLGPFILGLMTHVATAGSVLYGIFLFMVLSLGLGLPLAILAFFSGAITSLPGAGAWMVWVRKFFGIILIIMAIYIGQPLFSENIFVILIVLTGVAGGIYLAREPSGGGNFVYFKKTVGLFMILAALAFGCQSLELSTTAPQQQQQESQITWHDYTDKAVRRAAGKPVVLDFTATWCQPCRQMERQTFPDPQVQALLKQFACIRVDVTNGPPNADAKRLIDKWGMKGVPTFMFLDRQGKVMSQYTFVGFVDAKAMAQHLQQVLRAAGK